MFFMKNELEKVKEEFASRLNLAMDELNYPVRGRARVLSKEFSVSDKGAGKWVNGEAIPETSKIPLIAAFLGINAEWLLSGVGDMRPLSQSQSLGTMTQSQGTPLINENFLTQSHRSHALHALINKLDELEQQHLITEDDVSLLKHTLDVLAKSKSSSTNAKQPHSPILKDEE